MENKIKSNIINPKLKNLKKKKNNFNGFLYAGLMIKKNEPYLIEYNIRMGDPECQVIVPRLKSDIVKIVLNTISNKLKKTKIKWSNKKSMTIVLCSRGYPGKYKKNLLIDNLNRVKLINSDYIYHAGTTFFKNKLRSNGGRVLNFTSVGKNFKIIRRKHYYLIKKLSWKKGFYRKDIGWKVIKKK